MERCKRARITCLAEPEHRGAAHRGRATAGEIDNRRNADAVFHFSEGCHRRGAKILLARLLGVIVDILTNGPRSATARERDQGRDNPGVAEYAEPVNRLTSRFGGAGFVAS